VHLFYDVLLRPIVGKDFANGNAPHLLAMINAYSL